MTMLMIEMSVPTLNNSGARSCVTNSSPVVTPTGSSAAATPSQATIGAESCHCAPSSRTTIQSAVTTISAAAGTVSIASFSDSDT